MKILRRIKNKIIKKKILLKVYSHPRSGTHFLEAFIAENFYKTYDLSLNEITWGHWSNRKVNLDGNPYGKLFGNHYFGKENDDELPKVYIRRDGRSVMLSLWKTPNFIHKNISKISLKDFLRLKLDWSGSPSRKIEGKMTPIEHWKSHVKSWEELNNKCENILILNYEDLVYEPYEQYLKLHKIFFNKVKLLSQAEINNIVKPVGLLPNSGKVDSWKEYFDTEDLDLYNKIMKD